MAEGYDFSGWATRNDIVCGDGRIIRQNAFLGNDGEQVPLVWQHSHSDPTNVLGHAILENRDEGVYTYCYFNSTEKAQAAKEQVYHGDIRNMSIFANHLEQTGPNVLHGDIKEVSLVLAGANPGAYIDVLHMAHSDEFTDEATIFTDEEIELCHSDDYGYDDEYDEGDNMENNYRDSETMSDDEIKETINDMDDDQKDAVYTLVGSAYEQGLEAGQEDLQHSDDEYEEYEDDEDYEDYDEDDEDDEDYDEEDEEDEEEYYEDEGEETMKHNLFDGTEEYFDGSEILSHDDMDEIFRDAKRLGSLRDSVIEHIDDGESMSLSHAVTNADDSTQTYGMSNVDYLFPEARNPETYPIFIKRNDDWVAKVMAGIKNTPFSRIKSVVANITMDEARAKGYFKGNKKQEEVFALLKRTTDPQTVYKKQKMDRDDIVDITDFDVVTWIKQEMRMMLNEELARAILIGDGRLTSSDDKISADHIRPIAEDNELYSVQVAITVAAAATESDKAKAFIRSAIKSRKNYKGSGNPALYTTEDMLAEMLLIEDTIGHTIYKDEAELAKTLRVSEIVTVPVMEGNAKFAIITNLNDYRVGADKGGEVNLFDDFDIDYNQMKYLIETRCSGALTLPYSALVFKFATAAQG